MPIIENPTLDFKTPPTVSIFYFAEGWAIFGCITDPEGVIAANPGSIALRDNGVAYIKVTGSDSAGWQALESGGGGGTVNPGVAPRFAYYPANGTTVDDTAGVEYSASSAPIITAEMQTATQQGIYAKEAASGAIANVGSSPSLLTLHAIDSATYYALGLLKDTGSTVGSFGILLNDDGNLAFRMFGVGAEGQIIFTHSATDATIEVRNQSGVGRLLLNTSDTAAVIGSVGAVPISFVVSNVRQALLSDNNLTLGVPSSRTVSLDFANSSSANTFRLLAGNGVQQNVTLPIALPTVGQALVASAVSGADVTLDYASAGSGTVNSGLAGEMAYYPSNGTTVDSATNLFNDEVNGRFGIGIAVPLWNQHIYKNVNTDVSLAIENPNGGDSANPSLILLANNRSYTVGVGSSTSSQVNARDAYFVRDRSGNKFRFLICSDGRTGINVDSNNPTATLQVYSHSDSAQIFDCFSQNNHSTSVPATQVSIDSVATNSIGISMNLRSKSSGTPADGFGSSLTFQLESSTTDYQDAGSIQWLWATAEHATRKARVVLNVFDTASREVMRGEASGSAPMIGFLGATAIARTSAYTPTNVTTDRSFDADTVTTAELADVVGTLIADLQAFGLLG